jgi:hypothetical protein
VEKGKTIIGASRLGVCRKRGTVSAFQDRQGGRGVEWSKGRARGSPGAVARARGGGEHSCLVLPLRRLALQQPDFPEMMRPSGPMGAQERRGGGVAESGPGNPAKCLDFFAAPRTRQCAPLLRRGRTCFHSLSRTEPNRTEPNRAELRRGQPRWPEDPSISGIFRFVRASRTYTATPCLALRHPLRIAPAAKVSSPELRGHRRVPWNKRRTGHQEVGARDTLGRGGALAREGAASGREAGRGVHRPLAALGGLRARSRCGASW